MCDFYYYNNNVYDDFWVCFGDGGSFSFCVYFR